MQAQMETEQTVDFQRLVNSASQLYTLPDIYFKVRSIINDPNSQMADLSSVLSNDPGLSARLLRMANSAFFGMQSEVDTITRAVQIIGFKHIYDLVIATSITKAFGSMSNDVMSMDAFWIASTERALICRFLATSFHLREVERLFVTGLLLDIGHLVIYEHCPEEAKQAIAISQAHMKPLNQVEKELLGFDASELGAALAKSWNFPEQFSMLIASQDDPRLDEGQDWEVCVVHIAKQLAGVAHDSDAVESVFSAIDPQVRNLTGLSHELCMEAVAEVAENLSDTLDMILPNR